MRSPSPWRVFWLLFFAQRKVTRRRPPPAGGRTNPPPEAAPRRRPLIIKDKTMTRFFAPPSAKKNNTIQLTADDAAHIKTLRIRPEELFTVCDGEGNDHICRLAEKNGGPTAEIIETHPTRGEPTTACDVYIALAKGDRLEYAVQKTIELGARSITLFQSERCISKPGDITKKTARLQRIALETAKQSGRGRIPEVTAANTFQAAVEKAANAGTPLFFYECEEEQRLKKALENWKEGMTVSILTGPEGGFEPHEAELAKAAGMRIITLGPRILRCETAPAAALAAIMYHTGDI